MINKLSTTQRKSYIYSMKKILLIIFALQVYTINAQSWSTFEGGLGLDPVNALIMYNGNLIIGGGAGGIQQWDGSAWSSLGTGVNGIVDALVIYNGNLIAGGQFTTAGGIPANNIAMWNGSAWSVIGKGVSGSVSIISPGVNALCVYNDSLFAAGYFDSAGGKRARNIAEWNGSNWVALGHGVDSTVYALAVYDSTVFAGGQFDSAGTVRANILAEWNGTSWSANSLGGSQVEALTVYNNNLVACGMLLPGNIAKWNGSTWTAFGSGISGGMHNVESLTTYSGNLIAGGMFKNAGGISANGVAQWNGSSWDSLGGGLDGGPNVIGVESLIEYDGLLIAGGEISVPGGPPCGIAQWGILTGFNELKVESEKVKVYPNPSNGIFSVELKGNSDKFKVEVYNIFGEKVISQFTIDHSPFTINLSSQPKGIYLYRVTSERGESIFSGKLVIQ